MTQQYAQQQVATRQQAKPIRKVVVTDVDISFGNMVMLLIKLAFASIPAAIIVWMVFAFMGFVLMSVLGIGGAVLSGL